jgi:hypothetical protein
MLPAGGRERIVAYLSQPLADFGQFGASLAIPENTRFHVKRDAGGAYVPTLFVGMYGPLSDAW